jgi:hypothetical protein
MTIRDTMRPTPLGGTAHDGRRMAIFQHAPPADAASVKWLPIALADHIELSRS